VANVDGAYCALEDLRQGDIPGPTLTTPQQYIVGAAEEIDAALGHIYVTPIVIDESDPKNRPSVLYLKKINWLLASGRAIADIATAGEQDSLHALARQYLNEAVKMIEALTRKDYTLTGAPLLDPGNPAAFSGPAIFNEDADSLVSTFYTGMRPTCYPKVPSPYPSVIPYDGQVVGSA
jgi:hypothetical protein